MMQSRNSILINLTMCVLIIAISMFCTSCSDSSTGPNDGDGNYWVYAADGFKKNIYRIDSQNDSVYDSLKMDDDIDFSSLYMNNSLDNKYLVLGYVAEQGSIRKTEFYDARSFEYIGEYPEYMTSFVLLDNNRFLKYLDIGTNMTSLEFYNIPSFSKSREDTVFSLFQNHNTTLLTGVYTLSESPPLFIQIRFFLFNMILI